MKNINYKCEGHLMTYASPCIFNALEDIFSDFCIPRDYKILDASCGDGFILHKLYKKGYKNIWGFDIDKNAIQVARKNFPEIKERFGIRSAYEKELPSFLLGGGYDLILSLEVIEHLFGPDEYLSNINRWLKKGGSLILTTPYHGHLKNLIIALSNRFDRHFNPLWDRGHIKFFSKSSLQQILKRNGFEIIKPENYKSLANTLNLFLSHKNQWKEMGQASCKIISNWKLELFSKNF